MNIHALYLALALVPPPPTPIDGLGEVAANEALLADIKAVEDVRWTLYENALPFRDFVAVYGYQAWPDATYAVRTLYYPRLDRLNAERRQRVERQHQFAEEHGLTRYRGTRFYRGDRPSTVPPGPRRPQ